MTLLAVAKFLAYVLPILGVAACVTGMFGGIFTRWRPVWGWVLFGGFLCSVFGLIAVCGRILLEMKGVVM